MNMRRILIMACATLLAVGCAGNSQVQQECTSAPGTVKTVSVEEFAKTITRDGVRLIDVRTPKEYAEEHLSKAENIDVKAPDFGERTKNVKGTVAVYCRGGRRSLQAATQLAAQGCTVYDLGGGIMAWKAAGQPTTLQK